MYSKVGMYCAWTKATQGGTNQKTATRMAFGGEAPRRTFSSSVFIPPHPSTHHSSRKGKGWSLPPVPACPIRNCARNGEFDSTVCTPTLQPHESWTVGLVGSCHVQYVDWSLGFLLTRSFSGSTSRQRADHPSFAYSVSKAFLSAPSNHGCANMPECK